MLFNSIDFAVFLPLVFILYWFVFKNNTNRQNLFLTLSSYVFYGWWDWRFLSLILFSTLVDYTIGIGLLKSDKQKNRKRKNTERQLNSLFKLAIDLLSNRNGI